MRENSSGSLGPDQNVEFVITFEHYSTNVFCSRNIRYIVVFYKHFVILIAYRVTTATGTMYECGYRQISLTYRS